METVLRPPYSMHVSWSNEDEAYIAVCPEFDNLSAFGSSPEDAARELRTAVDAVIEVYREDGEALPQPSLLAEFSGKFNVRLPRSLHARLSAAAEREGVSLNTFVVTQLSAADAAHAAARAVVSQIDVAVRGAFAAVAPARYGTGSSPGDSFLQAPQNSRHNITTATEGRR